jgi:radical SAM superfamily enzyme YgiQ (UPF0313 family)
MKVFLLTSPYGRPEPLLVYPLGPAYLAAHLAGHDVVGYDCNLPGHSLAEGLKQASAFDAEVLCVSFRNVDTTQERDLYSYYPNFLAVVSQARAAFPSATIVAGGSAFSIYGAQVMAEAPAIDVGVVNEGEAALPEIIAARGDYARVRGVLYRDGTRVVASPPRPPSDFASSLPPDHRVFDLRAYKDQPFAVGVQTRRGCFRACSYCTYPMLEGRRLRIRRVKDVIAEIEALRAAGVETFAFVDSLWAIPRAIAEELCREMIRRDLGMTWRAFFDEATFDGELADLALEAGAAEFFFSPDGATDEVLAALGKEFRAEDLYRTLEVLRLRPRSRVSYSFFLNPPGQTLAGFGQIVKFHLRSKKVLGDSLQEISFGNIRLEAGTPAYERAVAEGRIRADANLLPRTSAEMRNLFYHTSSVVKLLSWLYVFLRQFRRLLKKRWGG